MSTRRNAYTPSSFVLMAKAAFSVLEKCLPEQVFRALFDATVSAYRVMIRFMYLRFWLCAVLTGDAKARRKVNLVFRVMPYSLVGWRGLEVTYDTVLAVQEQGVSGSIVECGVAQGGSAALMALIEAQVGYQRAIWLFDSFEGLPDPTDKDFLDGTTGKHARVLSKGSCLGSYEKVAYLLFEQLRLSPDHVFMVKGWFQDTLPVHQERIGPISLLRIDADWYESVKCCLDNLYDNVVPQGFIIIDDYWSCFGAQKAVDEFLQRRGQQADMVSDGRGGVHFVKPGR